MLDLAEARPVAERYLEQLRQTWPDYDVVLDDRHTVERPTLFAFVYNSRAFVEDGDEMAILVGPGPLIVDRRTGELHARNSASSVEHHVRDYETASPTP